MAGMVYDVSEKSIRSNAPLSLFTVEVDGAKVEVKSKLLGADAADAWLETYCFPVECTARKTNLLKARLQRAEANSQEAKDDDIKESDTDAEATIRLQLLSTKREYVKVIRNALKAMNPDVFTEPILTAATAAQLFSAYERIYELTDPLQVGFCVQIARVAQLTREKTNTNANAKK